LSENKNRNSAPVSASQLWTTSQGTHTRQRFWLFVASLFGITFIVGNGHGPVLSLNDSSFIGTHLLDIQL
jgi:hypothetical protein